MAGTLGQTRFPAWVLVGLLAVVGCRSKGICVSGFITPTYRLPSGYSETYRQRLLADDAKLRSKELLNPALNELPSPVPYTPPPGLMPAPNPDDDMMRPKDRMPFPPAPSDASGKTNSKKP